MNITKKADNKGEIMYRSELKERINSTAVKLFINDRQAFVKQIIYGEAKEYKDTASTIMGSLVHCMILEKEKFDDKYTVSTITEPTGQILELCQNLYTISVKSINADGVQTRQFEQLFADAVTKTKYDWELKEINFKGKDATKILELFTTPDKKTGVTGEMYYKNLLENHGKTVVSVNIIQKAENIVNEMRSNEWISKWINAEDTHDTHVYNEHVIEFQYKSILMRALLDRFIVNHKEKKIEILDIKSTWDADGVAYTYLKSMWYIQAAIYHMAIEQFQKDNNLENYKVEGMRFLICDTGGFYCSTSYQVTPQDIEMARTGFRTPSGKWHTGAIEALDEIVVCIETGKWNQSQEQVEKCGQMTFGIQYINDYQ